MSFLVHKNIARCLSLALTAALGACASGASTRDADDADFTQEVVGGATRADGSPETFAIKIDQKYRNGFSVAGDQIRSVRLGHNIYDERYVTTDLISYDLPVPVEQNAQNALQLDYLIESVEGVPTTQMTFMLFARHDYTDGKSWRDWERLDINGITNFTSFHYGTSDCTATGFNDAGEALEATTPRVSEPRGEYGAIQFCGTTFYYDPANASPTTHANTIELAVVALPYVDGALEDGTYNYRFAASVHH